MQFLKILFWCLLAFLVALFTFGNWTTVPIQLWGNLVADVNLPLLLLSMFLLGFVPTSLYYQTVRWRLRQKLSSHERALADYRAPAVTAYDTTMPPGAVPTAVPPGVA